MDYWYMITCVSFIFLYLKFLDIGTLITNVLRLFANFEASHITTKLEKEILFTRSILREF